MRETVNWIAIVVLGLLAGTVAWVGLNTVSHAWSDHTALHQLWDLEVRRAQAVQQQQSQKAVP